MSVQNQLAQIRRARGISAATLAEKVGVSRQTVYAIEAGTYVPNTEITLKMARVLQVSVEEIFSLPEERAEKREPNQTEVLGSGTVAEGSPVQVCRVGKHLVSTPMSAVPYFLPEADGLVTGLPDAAGRAELLLFGGDEAALDKRLLIAGCDPAISLIARAVERSAGVEVVPAPGSSRQALDWLKAGKIHIAGSHLKDADTGEFNVPIVRREFAREDFMIVTFAEWEEGFVTSAGNPKRLRKASDLARRGVSFINREPGSGSRALLDGLLRQDGVPESKVTGYARVANGHLAAAYAVSLGEADCCIATRSAARTFGLDFVPLQTERYDFILRRKSLELSAVQSFLDMLQRATVRRKLEGIAGYETARTGAVVSS